MKNLKNKMKSINGITLIALVITIVILIILAGVAINTLVNNGIIDKARTATQEYENAQDYEENQLAKYTNDINNYISGNRDYTPISYSTEEQDTGMKWIDGKTVYKKVLTNLNLSGTWGDASHLNGSDWYTIYCNVPTGMLDNVDTIIDLRGIGDNKYSASLTYDGYRLAYTGTSYGLLRTIIMEYTKTTPTN